MNYLHYNNDIMFHHGTRALLVMTKAKHVTQHKILNGGATIILFILLNSNVKTRIWRP